MSEVAAVQGVDRRLSSGVADAASSYIVPVTAVDATSGVTDNSYQSFLAQVPVDWEIKPLGRIAKIVGGGTPSRDTKSFWGGDVPWVTPGEVSKEDSKYLIATAERITAAGLAGSGANLLPLGSLLVTTRATLGARAIAGVPVATNQGFKSLVFPSTTDADFYFYLAPKFKPELVRRASGTTFLEISSREFARIEVPCPPVDEKRWIAQILDTLDTAIRQTEAIIAKLKQIKQGLLHDLLTRGIDANGELRPPQPQAPQLYKQSQLGWIPKEWGCSMLGDVIDGSPRNGIYKPAGDIGSGVLLVGQTAFTSNGSIDFDQARRSRVTNAELKAFGLAEQDLLVSRVFATREGVGQPVIVPEMHESAVYESNMMRLRARRAVIHPTLLLYWLKSQTARSWVVSRAFASNQASINRGTLCTTPVPLLSAGEQLVILNMAESEYTRERQETVTLDKQRRLKSGLMDDLLTGRVRVTPLLETATK